MSRKLEPAIWSRDTGQRITCFDRCHLIVAGMSNIKEVHGKPSCMSLSTYFLESGRHVARLRRRRAYAPTSNTASHDNHKENPSWVSFSFPWCLWSSAIKTKAMRALWLVNQLWFIVQINLNSRKIARLPNYNGWKSSLALTLLLNFFNTPRDFDEFG